MSPQLLTVGDVAERAGCRPRDVSDALYHRELGRDLFIVAGWLRLLPAERLEQAIEALRPFLARRRPRRTAGAAKQLV